jgi:hypothetical protein
MTMTKCHNDADMTTQMSRWHEIGDKWHKADMTKTINDTADWWVISDSDKKQTWRCPTSADTDWNCEEAPHI